MDNKTPNPTIKPTPTPTSTRTYYIYLDENGTPRLSYYDMLGTTVLTTTDFNVARCALHHLAQTTPTSLYTLSYETGVADEYDFGTEVFSSLERAEEAKHEWFITDLHDFFDITSFKNLDIAALMDGNDHYLRDNGTETNYSNADIIVCYRKDAYYRIIDIYSENSCRVWIREKQVDDKSNN